MRISNLFLLLGLLCLLHGTLGRHALPPPVQQHPQVLTRPPPTPRRPWVPPLGGGRAPPRTLSKLDARLESKEGRFETMMMRAMTSGSLTNPLKLTRMQAKFENRLEQMERVYQQRIQRGQTSPVDASSFQPPYQPTEPPVQIKERPRVRPQPTKPKKIPIHLTTASPTSTTAVDRELENNQVAGASASQTVAGANAQAKTVSKMREQMTKTAIEKEPAKPKMKPSLSFPSIVRSAQETSPPKLPSSEVLSYSPEGPTSDVLLSSASLSASPFDAASSLTSLTPTASSSASLSPLRTAAPPSALSSSSLSSTNTSPLESQSMALSSQSLANETLSSLLVQLASLASTLSSPTNAASSLPPPSLSSSSSSPSVLRSESQLTSSSPPSQSSPFLRPVTSGFQPTKAPVTSKESGSETKKKHNRPTMNRAQKGKARLGNKAKPTQQSDPTEKSGRNQVYRGTSLPGRGNQRAETPVGETVYSQITVPAPSANNAGRVVVISIPDGGTVQSQTNATPLLEYVSDSTVRTPTPRRSNRQNAGPRLTSPTPRVRPADPRVRSREQLGQGVLSALNGKTDYPDVSFTSMATVSPSQRRNIQPKDNLIMLLNNFVPQNTRQGTINELFGRRVDPEYTWINQNNQAASFPMSLSPSTAYSNAYTKKQTPRLNSLLALLNQRQNGLRQNYTAGTLQYQQRRSPHVVGTQSRSDFGAQLHGTQSQPSQTSSSYPTNSRGRTQSFQGSQSIRRRGSTGGGQIRIPGPSSNNHTRGNRRYGNNNQTPRSTYRQDRRVDNTYAQRQGSVNPYDQRMSDYVYNTPYDQRISNSVYDQTHRSQNTRGQTPTTRTSQGQYNDVYTYSSGMPSSFDFSYPTDTFLNTGPRRMRNGYLYEGGSLNSYLDLLSDGFLSPASYTQTRNTMYTPQQQQYGNGGRGTTSTSVQSQFYGPFNRDILTLGLLNGDIFGL